MAAIKEKYPITLEERMKLGGNIQRYTGTFEEFIQLADICEYPVEFDHGKIIAKNIASDLHEQIVANILGIFFMLFRKKTHLSRYGSNRHIYCESPQKAYSPDASIVKGDPEIFEYAKGKTANKNPWLVVEVLSNSTRKRDWGEKLPSFKQISSLQYILYIEQDFSFVTVFERVENTSRWTSTDYNELDQHFTINGEDFLLADIYENIKFSG